MHPIIFRYGKAVGSEVMMQYAAYLNSLSGQKAPSSGRDIFRTLQSLLYAEEKKEVESVYESPAYTWYPETEFCYMANKSGLFFAAKAAITTKAITITMPELSRFISIRPRLLSMPV